jgi:hypothetical protein
MLMLGSGSVNNNYGSGFRSGSVQKITDPARVLEVQKVMDLEHSSKLSKLFLDSA